MPFFPLCNVNKTEGYCTIHNFPPNNWEEVSLGHKYLWAIYSDGNKWIVHVDKRPIALFKYEKQFYALKNGCLHQGFPLADGNLSKYMVECPLHGWVYDVRNGSCLSLKNKSIKTYPIRINNNFLEIEID